jgi:hypothetical protein
MSVHSYPLGTIMEQYGGRVMIKVERKRRVKGRVTQWIAAARYLWMQAYGDVPANSIITTKNGNKLDLRLENLECISRSELLARQRIYVLYPVPMIATLRAHKKLKRIIDKK